MNRHDRRRKAVMARHNRFVSEYVHHLPEVGPGALGRPGITHVVFYHDKWCRIYGGRTCNCKPDVRIFAEPKRS